MTVTPVFTGKTVSTVVVPYSYETNVPNDEEVWTSDKAMIAKLDHALSEDDRVTLSCRRWSHRGGREVIKVSE